MKTVTAAQWKVLDFIDRYTKEKGYSPTYQVIANGIGLKSLATVAKHVSNLIGKERLKKVYNEQQTLEVVVEERTQRFVFEGPNHLWDRAEGCYWIREKDKK